MSVKPSQFYLFGGRHLIDAVQYFYIEMKPKVGFMLVCDENYPAGIAEEFAEQAIQKMMEIGMEVDYTGKATQYVSDAVKIARDFWCKDVDLFIVMIGTWIEAPLVIAAIEEVKDLPLLVWSLRMYIKEGRRESTGSLPGAGVVRATLDEMGRAFKFIVGLPEDDGVVQRVYDYAKVSQAIKKLRHARIGLVGYASMGMYTSTFDHITLRDKIGPEVKQIDHYHLKKAMDQVPLEEARKTAKDIRKRVYVENDVTDQDLEMAARMYLAFKKLIRDYDLDAISPECWYILHREFKFAACVPLALLAEDGIVTSCEADIHLTVTMMIFNYLTGRPIYYGDVIDVHDNQIYFSSCGFAPFSVAADPSSMGIARHRVGLRCAVVLPPGRVTVARLEGRKGTYRMHIATGEAIETELRQGRMPATEVIMDGDVESFLQNLLSQHYAVAQLDIKDQLLDICELLGIKAIVT
jgi:L-fucose isomerase-like protein